MCGILTPSFEIDLASLYPKRDHLSKESVRIVRKKGRILATDFKKKKRKPPCPCKGEVSPAPSDDVQVHRTDDDDTTCDNLPLLRNSKDSKAIREGAHDEGPYNGSHNGPLTAT